MATGAPWDGSIVCWCLDEKKGERGKKKGRKKKKIRRQIYVAAGDKMDRVLVTWLRKARIIDKMGCDKIRLHRMLGQILLFANLLTIPFVL